MFVPLLAPMQLQINPMSVALPLVAGVATIAVGVLAVRARARAGGGPGLQLPVTVGGMLLILTLLD